MKGKGIKTYNMLCSSADIHLSTTFIKRVLGAKDVGTVSLFFPIINSWFMLFPLV